MNQTLEFIFPDEHTEKIIVMIIKAFLFQVHVFKNDAELSANA